MIRAAGATLLLATLLAPALPSAQETAAPATRAEMLERQREARERALAPYRPGRIERLLLFVEDKRVIERLNPPEGVYPALGGLTTGSGYGFGAGYRLRPGSGLLLDGAAKWTFRNYKQARVTLGWPSRGGRPVGLRLGTQWYDYTQEDYFGLGPDSAVSDRVSFNLRGLDTFGEIEARKAGWLVLGGRAGVHDTEVGPGHDARFPSIEDRYSDRTAPGLDESPSLGYGTVSAAIDTRDQRGNTRGGGLYRVALSAYRDRHGEGYDFNRLDAVAMHVIPIFDKKRGFLVRASASRVDPLGGDRVPFFMVPTVGGSDSLRGYRDFRFRDAAAITVNAEYRWEAFSGLDLALFYDAGAVAPTFAALSADRLKTSWGGGFRFNTDRRVFLRLDAATGGEGTRIWIRMAPVFSR